MAHNGGAVVVSHEPSDLALAQLVKLADANLHMAARWWDRAGLSDEGTGVNPATHMLGRDSVAVDQ
ncbi:MAG: hypothetical protein M3360_00795 [Actinomycetota bacterium]|nr:hypothetical protein [Actinomycetota bacterium]